MAGRWVDVGEAARELGISTDAVRKRIARGSLESDRPNGHVLVWLDGGGTEAGQDAQDYGRGALVEMLADQVAYLRSQLDQERQANLENRRIIGGLLQRVPELQAPQDERGAPETTAEDQHKSSPASTNQETPTERSWWRRLLGN